MEILVDIFTRLSVFNSPKGSSNTFKACKNISNIIQKKAPNNINSFAKRHKLVQSSCCYA